MKYIEIQDGTTINVECIEAVEKVTDTSCNIYTRQRAYRSSIPYEAFIEMIKSEESVNKPISNDAAIKATMGKLDKVLKGVGHFSG